jgi:hypothetical protein
MLTAPACRAALPLAVAGWLLGCGAPSGETAPPSPGTPAERARAVVAARVGIASEDVQVISVLARDFPDSSLDCPEPGMSYLQVITPGHQVIVEADGRRFDVRVSGASARICHRRKPAGSGRRVAKPPLQELAERARADLAQRLQAEPTAIAVIGVRALGTEDRLPGCDVLCAPDNGFCGYAVALKHDGRQYAYFAADGHVEPCPPILPG